MEQCNVAPEQCRSGAGQCGGKVMWSKYGVEPGKRGASTVWSWKRGVREGGAGAAWRSQGRWSWGSVESGKVELGQRGVREGGAGAAWSQGRWSWGSVESGRWNQGSMEPERGTRTVLSTIVEAGVQQCTAAAVKDRTTRSHTACPPRCLSYSLSPLSTQPGSQHWARSSFLNRTNVWLLLTTW